MVVDALSRKYALLSILETKFLGFECTKELYEHDDDFSNLYHTSSHTAFEGYFQRDGYLIKDKRLYIHKGSIGRILVKEVHEEQLLGHFRVRMTYNLLH